MTIAGILWVRHIGLACGCGIWVWCIPGQLSFNGSVSQAVEGYHFRESLHDLNSVNREICRQDYVLESAINISIPTVLHLPLK